MVRTFRFLAIVATLLFYKEGIAATSTPPQALATWFSRELALKANEKGLPGFAAGLIVDGKVVLLKLYGVCSKSSKEPITTETVFQLGSLSKALAGTLMGVLFEKKMLHFNQPLSFFTSDFRYKAGELTLHHILTHSSGLPRFDFNALIEGEKHTKEQIFERLDCTPPTCDLGTCYEYHNVVFSLVSRAVEKVTGQSYPRALDFYLFHPLGMRYASASYSDFQKNHSRAVPHQKTKEGFKPYKAYRLGYYDMAPAGGANASLLDMMEFLKAIMGYRPDVIKPETLKILHSPYIEAPDLFQRNPMNKKRFKSSSYGLGMRILEYEGHTILFHGGWLKGFINVIAFMPDKKVGVVILQNAETSFPWKMAMMLFDKVLGIEGREWGKDPKKAIGALERTARSSLKRPIATKKPRYPSQKKLISSAKYLKSVKAQVRSRKTKRVQV